MKKKPGPKRPVGRPPVAAKRARQTRTQSLRRATLQSYGLEKIELWVKPGELDAVRADALLRICELDLVRALRDGDAMDVLRRRVALEKQRQSMGLPSASEDDLVLAVAEGAGLRSLRAGVVPTALARSRPDPIQRGNVTLTPRERGLSPQDLDAELKRVKPSWML